MIEDYDDLYALFDPDFTCCAVQHTTQPSRMGEIEEGFKIDAMLVNSSLHP